MLIEEGAEVDCEPFSLQEMGLKYRWGGLNPALGKPKIAFVEARCVGGGSEINSGLYHRTPESILDTWRRDFNIDHIGMREMDPHFGLCEANLGVQLSPGPSPRAGLKLRDGAEVLGWSTAEARRWVRYGATTGPDGAPYALRRGMTATYLPQALSAGCRLVANTRALRFERKGDGWVIDLECQSRLIQIRADSIFVCAGATQTAALLRRSGIRDHVGDSLALHAYLKVAARFDEQVNYPGLGVPAQQVVQFSPQMTMGCSISSLPYLSLLMVDHPAHQRAVRERWYEMALYYVSVVGETTGRVRPVPFTDDVLVTYNLSDRMLMNLTTGLVKLSTLLLAAGAKEIYPSVHQLGPIRCAADVRAIPDVLRRDELSLSTIHLFSSCRMGERGIGGVNSFGQPHCVPSSHNLIINDASLLCTAPGVNPQGTIMALASRNTLRFLGEL